MAWTKWTQMESKEGIISPLFECIIIIDGKKTDGVLSSHEHDSFEL